MTSPLIITVAGVGAELSKKDTPHVPITPSEIIEEAKAVFKLGAHVFHLHVRDDAGKPTLEPKRLREVIQGIRMETDLIIQASTGGDIRDTFDDRVGVLECGMDMASLTLGSVNFGEEVFLNPLSLIRRLAQKMDEKGIRPELEIFDLGMMDTAAWLIAQNLIRPPFHFNIILGGRGWLGATEENLDAILSKMPADSTWSASGVGRHQAPMVSWGIERGGHVRTGLEDNIFKSKGVLAKGNVDLVEEALRLAQLAGRRLATPDEARHILGVKNEMDHA